MVDNDVLALSATEEAKWLHGLRNEHVANMPGYAVIGRKGHGYCPRRRRHVDDAWQQKSYPISALDAAIAENVGAKLLTPDTYISQATFAYAGRRAAGFQKVQSAWVDLDHYDDSYDPKEWSHVKLEKIQSHVRSLGLPEPTLVINSGRGAYVKWMFTQPTSDLPLWNTVQSTLATLFADLDVDYGARDASRVLRCLGTINRKNQCQVDVIAGSGKEHDFREFAKVICALFNDEVGPHLEQSSKSPRTRRQSNAGKRMLQALENSARGDMAALELYKSVREPIMLEAFSVRSLNWARFTDLRDLVLMRGGFIQGERNNMLLWMCNSLAHAKVLTPQNWDIEIDDLLKAFPVGPDFTPVESGYLESLRSRLVFEASEQAQSSGGVNNTSRLKSRGLYRPSNKFLIEQFKISTQEQERLKTIIDEEVKSQRTQKRRDTLNPGRAQRRESRLAWHAKAEHMLQLALQDRAEGFDAHRLPTATMLGINVSEYSKDQQIERTALSKFLVKKISAHFNAKSSTDSEYIEKPTESVSTETPPQMQSAAQAVESLIAIKAKRRAQIEEVIRRESVIGQRKLRQAVDRIRARATPDQTDRADGCDQASDGIEQWAKEKVNNMTASLIQKTTAPSMPAQPGWKHKQGLTGRPADCVGAGSNEPAVKLKANETTFAQKISRLRQTPGGLGAGAVSSDTDPNAAKQGEGAGYFVPKKIRPRLFPSVNQWLAPKLPLNSEYCAGNWASARQEDRFFVIEIIGSHKNSTVPNGLVRFVNPMARGDVAQAGADIYGEIFAAPDARTLALIRSLDGCTLLADKCVAKVVEAVESEPCLFMGQSFWISRAPSAYMVDDPRAFVSPPRPAFSMSASRSEVMDQEQPNDPGPQPS